MGAPIGNKFAVGNNGGRPKIGLDVLWDGWHDDILELYSVGGSDVEVRALIFKNCKDKTKISVDLWDRWINEEDEFSLIIKMGRLLSEAWWSENGRTNLINREFNYVGWYMNMKNRFGWKDKQENTNTEKVTIVDLSEYDEIIKSKADK